MKKKLFGLLLFSLVLSSLAYAKVRDTENQEAAQNVAGTSIVKLSPEEEKEAFKALERARKRIEKEDKEREEAQAKAQAEAEEQQKQVQQVQETAVQENGNTVTEVVTTASGLTPEEEKEAFKALERARKRIEKEDKERAEALKLAEEQARAQAAQTAQE